MNNSILGNLGTTEMVLILGIVLFFLFGIIGMWKAFIKAGQPGWACIIPLYNYYIMSKMAGKEGHWVFLCMIPYIGIIFYIILLNGIAKGFGKGGGMTVMLTFFFGWMILGFGDAVWGDSENDNHPEILHA